MEAARQAVRQILSEKIKGELPLEIPDHPENGDLAFPCFALAKEQKKNPMQLAMQLASSLKPSAWIKKIEPKGPYVNFFLEPKVFAKIVLDEINQWGAKYGSKIIPTGERIVIEYPSPNTNKPLHLGHLRNIFLGQSTSHLLASRGVTVFQVNLNNDRGVHICKSMMAYQRWGNNAKPNKKSDHFVGDWYVKFSVEAKNNALLEQEAQEMLQKWERGDTEIRALWEKMNRWALEGFAETYRRLNILFDKVYNESEFYDKGKLVVEEGLKKRIFVKREDGSILVPLEDVKLPDKIVLRADGTSIYMTQDMYLAKLKFKDFEFDRSLFVVASEQNLHFQQLFAIMKKLGYAWADQLHHLSYGMVNLPTGRMKSREGTVVDADDLLDEMEALCAAEIKKRHVNTPIQELEKRAKQIGHGALRFFMLKQDHAKDIVYSPEESIALEGETGPYVQYAAARINSVLRKYGKSLPKTFDASLLTTVESMALVKKIALFPEMIDRAAKHCKPSLLAHYLIELSQQFNTFYHNNPILQAEEQVKTARLLLIAAVRQVIENGLGLLEIHIPEEM